MIAQKCPDGRARVNGANVWGEGDKVPPKAVRDDDVVETGIGVANLPRKGFEPCLREAFAIRRDFAESNTGFIE
jgi:hypothetical protein